MHGMSDVPPLRALQYCDDRYVCTLLGFLYNKLRVGCDNHIGCPCSDTNTELQGMCIDNNMWGCGQPDPRPSLQNVVQPDRDDAIMLHSCAQKFPRVSHCLRAFDDRWDECIQRLRYIDIRAEVTTNRQIATYVQHMYNGSTCNRHIVHSMAHIPYQVYTDWLRFRLLLVDLPVYNAPKMSKSQMQPALAFSQRLCPFGCSSPGDITHAMLECPHTTAVFDGLHAPFPSVRDMFDPDLYDQTEIAFCVSRLMRLLCKTTNHGTI